MPRTKVRYNWRQDLSQPRAAPQLPDLTRENAVNARLAQFPLEQQAREAQLSRAQAAEAQARYKMGKEIETDRQRTAFYNGLQELEQSLSKDHPIGTKGHAEAFAAYAHEFPLARSSADVNQMLKLHAVVNDDQAALKQRMLELSPPPEKIAQRYAKVQGDVSQFEEQLKGDISRQAKSNAGTPNVPYNPAFDETSGKISGNLQGAKVEKSILERQYPQLAGSESGATTDAVAPTATSAPIATAAPTTTDPRIDLARRALDDPNATDAHKAKAREILGVQEDNAE